MPFLKRKKTKNYTYGIWKITENIDYLLENLNPSHKELIHINQITHPTFNTLDICVINFR